MSEVAEQVRGLVAGWDDRPWVLGVVTGPGSEEWNADAAVELAQAVGERRRPAFLANLSPELEALDRAFEAERGPGLTDVLAGEGTFADIARKASDRSFAYLPAGEGATLPGELLEAAALGQLAERLRDAGGSLLVVLPRGAVEQMHRTEWLDGYVAFAPEGATATFSGRLPALGRLEPPTGEPVEAAEAPGRWRRHRDQKEFPAAKVAIGVALLLALGGGWWWFAERSTPDEGSVAGAATEVLEEGREADAREAGTGGSGDPAAGDPEADAASGSVRAEETGPPPPDAGTLLPYSVLIASYASPRDASDRARRLAERMDEVFFVAPTPVQGRLYHRVFAGSHPDTSSAGRLMRRLVEVGAKDEARTWDVRPVRWTYELGIYWDRGAAVERRSGLQRAGVPAYLLPAPTDGDSVWRVYAGAYEDSTAAAALGELIREAGQEPQLVRRRGPGRAVE